MKMLDIFEFALINSRKNITSSKGVMIILSIIIIAFNSVYSLTASLKETSYNNISGNSNLKIIEVESLDDGISEKLVDEIAHMDNVETTFYNVLTSCAVEVGTTGYSIDVIGLDSKQASIVMDDDTIELNDNEIILNTSYHNSEINVGDTVSLSYNARVSEGEGVRTSTEVTVIGFYSQPVVDSWSNDVALVSKNLQNYMLENLYGKKIEEIKEMKIGEQRILVFVNDVKNVSTVAKNIEKNQLITLYALKASENLPMFGKMIIIIGVLLIIILIIMSIVIISSTINNSIRKRYKEIGILKTIGFKESSITYLLFSEIIIMWAKIAFVSSVISVAMIYIWGKLLNVENIQLDNISISIVQLLLSAFMVLAIMVIATYKVIKSATKLNEIEVLRYE